MTGRILPLRRAGRAAGSLAAALGVGVVGQAMAQDAPQKVEVSRSARRSFNLGLTTPF